MAKHIFSIIKSPLDLVECKIRSNGYNKRCVPVLTSPFLFSETAYTKRFKFLSLLSEDVHIFPQYFR